MTRTEIIREIRYKCKLNGLTFKLSNNTFNGKPLYYFINSETGAVVLSKTQKKYMTLSSALDNGIINNDN